MINQEKFKDKYNFIKYKTAMEKKLSNYTKRAVDEKNNDLVSRISLFVNYYNRMNPHFDPINNDKVINELNQFYNCIYNLTKHQIPEFYPHIITGYYDEIYNVFKLFQDDNPREDIIWFGNNYLIEKDTIQNLAKYMNGGKCLEIMCDNGMIGSGLSMNGIPTIKTTKCPNDCINSWGNEKDPVIEMNPFDAITKYGKEVSYIICAHSFINNDDYKLFTRMRYVNPDCTIILIFDQLGYNFQNYIRNHFHQDNVEYAENFYLNNWGHFPPYIGSYEGRNYYKNIVIVK